MNNKHRTKCLFGVCLNRQYNTALLNRMIICLIKNDFHVFWEILQNLSILSSI